MLDLKQFFQFVKTLSLLFGKWLVVVHQVLFFELADFHQDPPTVFFKQGRFSEI